MLATIEDDVAAYEAWLRRRCDVVEADLAKKHRRMAEEPHAMLRATFFRWAKTAEALLPKLAAAPSTLCVGDIHVENFGDWRDQEGRLVWGVNDYDEAAWMPAVFDLVRLSTSARLAKPLAIPPRKAAAALLAAYRKGLAAPSPMVLHDQHSRLRQAVTSTEAEQKAFWEKIAKSRSKVTTPPPDVAAGFARALPNGAKIKGVAPLSKGLGSLGRPRYRAVAAWVGGRLVREAKALVPSAWTWAHGEDDAPSLAIEAATGPHRCPDPFLITHKDWIFRRLSPDSRKIEFGDKALYEINERVLAAMGEELAAVHAVNRRTSAAIERDLAAREPDWLHRASKTAAAFVKDDHAAWAKRGRAQKNG